MRYIGFNHGLVDRLFDSGSESAEQFAQRFAKEHGLPAMTRGTDTNPPQPVHYWEYVSRTGWKVVVDRHKNLIFQDWRRTADNRR